MEMPVVVADTVPDPWADCVIPLPHEMSVAGVVQLPPDQVGILAAASSSPMVRSAVEELRAEYLARSGIPPDGASFRIHIGLLSSVEGILADGARDEARLRRAPNSDQAYVIRPAGEGGLVVSGLTDRGVYYGIQTLRQVLAARSTATVTAVPLATVTDWPDFEERGLWNSGLKTREHLPWLAGLKLNFEHLDHPVDPDPRMPTCPPLPVDLIGWARERAFHILPHCWHYDFWGMSPALGANHPDLIGRGDTARNPASVARPGYHPEARCPCASNPELVRLLAGWMEGGAAQGVREVSLWLTEYQPCRCACEACEKSGLHQLVLETKASIRAIQEARKRFPDLVARLFLTYNLLTAEEERACRTSLSSIPADGSIRAESVYGLQRPFDDHARAGNWTATYGLSPPLGGSWGSRGAHRLRFYPNPEAFRNRIRHLKEAGYRGVYNASSVVAGGGEKGFVERHLSDFHVSMLAEWTWNTEGRDARRFARAWASNRGYPSPERALQWLEAMLPVESALFPALDAIPAMSGAIRAGKVLRPGGAPGLEGLPDVENLDEMARTADRCEEMARAMGAADLAAESRLASSAIGMLREIRRLSGAGAMGGSGGTREMALEKIREAIRRMLAAAEEQTAAWIGMPSSVASRLDRYTEEYWRAREEGFRTAGSEAPR